MLEDIVGQNIKKKRIKNNWTLEDLVYDTRLEPTHVARIERGQHNATLLTLSFIAARLSLPLHGLFNEGEIKPDYSTLQRFFQNNFPGIKSKLAYMHIDSFGRTLLEQLTVRSIEHGALLSHGVFFELKPEYSDRRAVSYSITAVYEYRAGVHTETIHDVCTSEELARTLLSKLKRYCPSQIHFYETVYDFIDALQLP